MMHMHNLYHQVTSWESDVVKDTAPQEGIGEFFFRIRRDEVNRPVFRHNTLVRLENIKIHLVEFVQQVVGKLDVRFVNFVNEQHHLCVCSKRLPETSEPDIAL